MKKNRITFNQIKEYLAEKGLILRKRKKNNFFKNDSLNSLARTFLSSIFIISIFYVIPVFIEFKNERKSIFQEFENDSKSIFTNTLKNKNLKKLSKLDDELIRKYIFEDVFVFNDLPNDYVRLSASTINQLFKDTEYNLEEVRKTKLVKPISLSLLPREMQKIENTIIRKKLLTDIPKRRT